MRAADSETPFLLDFRGLAPTPERFIRIVEQSVSLPCTSLVIDWGGRFPWSIDDAIRRTDAYPEQMVDAVARCCGDSGCRLSILLRSALPEGYSSRPGYRHLERARRGRADEWGPAVEKTVSDLLDDARGLLNDLDSVSFVAADPDASLIAAAADRAGLACHGLVPGECERDADLLGGIEERLVRVGHPAAGQVAFPDLHDELRRWRADGWRLVGALHEQLLRASSDPALCGRPLVRARSSLAAHLGGVRPISTEFRSAYAGRATRAAMSAFLGLVANPLREQYGGLSARSAALRSRL